MGKHAKPPDPDPDAHAAAAVWTLQHEWARPRTCRPGTPPSPPPTNTREGRRRWAIACRASADVLAREGLADQADHLRSLAQTAETSIDGTDLQPADPIRQSGGRR